MPVWYGNPEPSEWEWYYERDDSQKPSVKLPPNQWRCLMDHCEVMYLSRIPLIVPFARSRLEAFEISAALVWNGFVVDGGKTDGPRCDPIPVYLRGRSPDDTIENDLQLTDFLDAAWEDAYLCWLSAKPAALA